MKQPLGWAGVGSPLIVCREPSAVGKAVVAGETRSPLTRARGFAMTKRELVGVLASVPDDARVFIIGAADVGIVVHDSVINHVVLDEADGLRNSRWRVLYDPAPQLADEAAVGARREMHFPS